MRSQRRRLVRLHMKDRPESFEGVQLGRYRDGCYVLAKAALLAAPPHPGADPARHELDGELEVATSDVLFCQVLA